MNGVDDMPEIECVAQQGIRPCLRSKDGMCTASKVEIVWIKMLPVCMMYMVKEDV